MKLKINSFLPGQSIACVVIGFENDELKILVLKWKNNDLWTLPVGFVDNLASLDTAAIRVLKSRTGLKLPFLEQFYTFGSLDRRKFSNKPQTQKVFTGISKEFSTWVDQRFICTGYLSLVDIKKCTVTPDEISDACKWIRLKNIPKLLYDHNEMVNKAIDHIKVQLNYMPIGIKLLPKKFTMRQLQRLYECILQKEFDRGNFQKKMLKLDILVRCEKLLNGGAHKACLLYTSDAAD
ncbi:MAG: NUDIX domain-containing protein, partial [Urechidicola sp.]|nr:NUDIX domain-containing protein [Urechidicola sp.]